MRVYKPIGIESNYFANLLCKILNKNKVCVRGKLDPMARGIKVVLPNEHTKQMNYYLNS